MLVAIRKYRALADAGTAVLVSGVSEKTLVHSIGNEIAVRPNGFLDWWREMGPSETIACPHDAIATHGHTLAVDSNA